MDVCNKLVFVPARSYRVSLMFVGKARSLPSSGVPERSFSGAPLEQALDYLQTLEQGRLQRPTRDKHFSLLQTFIN